MKAIAYLRVSTEQQLTERQNDDINIYIKNNKIELVKTFQEKESGTKIVREALTNMLEFAITNKVDFVIISEVSRLGRTREVLKTIDDLHEHKIGLISIKEGIKSLNDDKTINHSSGLIIGMLAALNSYELSTIKYRSKSGIRRAFKEGKTLGTRSIPFGYKVEKGGYLRIDEEHSKIVVELFTKYLQGSGTVMLAKQLNKDGIKASRLKSNKINLSIDSGINKQDNCIDNTCENVLMIKCIYSQGRFKKNGFLKLSKKRNLRNEKKGLKKSLFLYTFICNITI